MLKLKEKYGCIFLIMAPVASNYLLLSFVSIGDVFAALGFLLLFSGCAGLQKLANQLRFILTLLLFLLFLFIVFTWGIFQIEPGAYRIFFYCILILLVPYLVNSTKSFFDIAEKFAIFFSASIIFQFLLFQFGFTLPLILPLPRAELDTLEIIEHVYRSGGWFREPSYFLIFLMPVLIYQARSAKYLKFSLNSVAAILSTSSFAFLVLIIIFIDHLLSTKTRIQVKLLALLLFVSFVFLISFIQETVLVARFLDILYDGGTLYDRSQILLTYSYEILSPLPNHSASESVLLIIEKTGAWISSAAYMLLLFGYLFVAFFILGMTYLRLLPLALFLFMVTVTHFMSTAFSLYFALALYLCYISPVGADRNRNLHFNLSRRAHGGFDQSNPAPSAVKLCESSRREM